MCGGCCDQRVAEIQGNLRQLKEKEAKLLNRSSIPHLIDLKKKQRYRFFTFTTNELAT